MAYYQTQALPYRRSNSMKNLVAHHTTPDNEEMTAHIKKMMEKPFTGLLEAQRTYRSSLGSLICEIALAQCNPSLTNFFIDFCFIFCCSAAESSEYASVSVTRRMTPNGLRKNEFKRNPLLWVRKGSESGHSTLFPNSSIAPNAQNEQCSKIPTASHLSSRPCTQQAQCLLSQWWLAAVAAIRPNSLIIRVQMALLYGASLWPSCCLGIDHYTYWLKRLLTRLQLPLKPSVSAIGTTQRPNLTTFSSLQRSWRRLSPRSWNPIV